MATLFKSAARRVTLKTYEVIKKKLLWKKINRIFLTKKANKTKQNITNYCSILYLLYQQISIFIIYQVVHIEKLEIYTDQNLF